MKIGENQSWIEIDAKEFSCNLSNAYTNTNPSNENYVKFYKNLTDLNSITNSDNSTDYYKNVNQQRGRYKHSSLVLSDPNLCSVQNSSQVNNYCYVNQQRGRYHRKVETQSNAQFTPSYNPNRNIGNRQINSISLKDVSRTLVTWYLCYFCSKPFKMNGKCLVKHQELCKMKAKTADNIRGINFASENKNNNNDLLDNFNLNLNESSITSDDDKLSDSVSSTLPSLVEDVQSNMDVGSLHIIYLNINSIFNKFEHIFSLLDLANLDIIALNEIKLDDTIPDKAFLHERYRLVRRDRSARGGGILIYVKKVIMC